MGKKKAADEAATKENVITDYTIDDDSIQVSIDEVEEVPPEEVESNQKWSKTHKYKGLYKDGKRGRYAGAVCYPEDYYSRLGTEDPEEVRKHILKMFEVTGLKVAFSPLHDDDYNADGSKKKLHFHIIVVYSGSTTYKVMSEQIRRITDGPYPIMLASVKGAYDYFTHKNNPEKAQYSPMDIMSCNGFIVPLGTAEESEIKDELEDKIIQDDIQTFPEMFYKYKWDCEYRTVMEKNHKFFRDLISDYAHNKRAAVEAYVAAGEEAGMAASLREELLKSIPDREWKFEKYLQNAENKRIKRVIQSKHEAVSAEADYEFEKYRILCEKENNDDC